MPKTKPPKTDSDVKYQPADCVCLGLRRAARTVTRLYDDALRPCGLRATQFSLLAVLFANGRAPFSDLAAMLALEQTTLSRNLQLLERRKLVQIVPGDDRRTRDVLLTSAGKTLYERAMLLWSKAQSHATNTLGHDRWKRMRTQLNRLIHDLPG